MSKEQKSNKEKPALSSKEKKVVKKSKKNSKIKMNIADHE